MLRSSATMFAMIFLVGACATSPSRSAAATLLTDSTSAPPAAPTKASATVTPSPIRIESVIGADEIILIVSTPVVRGQTARATVTTLPNAFCTIAVSSPTGPSKADGLGPKDADGGGGVSWSWTIEATATAGSWPVEVTCSTVSGLRAVARQVVDVR